MLSSLPEHSAGCGLPRKSMDKINSIVAIACLLVGISALAVAVLMSLGRIKRGPVWGYSAVSMFLLALGGLCYGAARLTESEGQAILVRLLEIIGAISLLSAIVVQWRSKARMEFK